MFIVPIVLHLIVIAFIWSRKVLRMCKKSASEAHTENATQHSQDKDYSENALHILEDREVAFMATQSFPAFP